MKITEEISITEFKPWSGAVSTVDRIINEGKADEFDNLIEEMYPDGLTSSALNDLLWFDSDWVYEMLGISEDDEDEDEDDEDDEDEDEDEDDEELEDLLDEELKDSNKKKVKDNEDDEGAIIDRENGLEIDYNKKYNLNDDTTLTEVAMNLYYDDDLKENDLFYLVNSNYIDEAIKIPYKTQIAVAWTYNHYGNDPDADAEFEEVDFMYPLTDDDDDYLTQDVIKKYTLELAGPDRVITPNEILKRNNKEKVIKFIKENNIIPEDIIEEKAQEYYEKEYGTIRHGGYEYISFD